MIRQPACTEPGCPPLETVVAVLPMSGPPCSRPHPKHPKEPAPHDQPLFRGRPRPRHRPHRLPGLGRTTVLNRILTEHHGLRITVIENEFGEVGIVSGIAPFTGLMPRQFGPRPR